MIGKPDKNGMRGVWIYVSKKTHPDHPQAGRKLYVGSYPKERGPGGAKEAEAKALANLTGKPLEVEYRMTCAEYAERWLERHHGEGTRRPSPSTYQQNESSLRPFLRDFGDAAIDGGITREEALDWSRKHMANAKVVSAMFNDAKDDGRTKENPFGNRRLPTKRGRRDIVPLTEREVERLGELALDAWNEYGRVVRGWVTFLAWTGCRPGEAASRKWEHCDLENGRVTFARSKGKKEENDSVVLPPDAVAALNDMPSQRPAAEAYEGLLFLTTRGKPYTIGSYSYYWRPVRAAFVASLEPERRKDLLSVKGALDVYACRHFCASLMADRGANEFEIAAQLGNSPEVCRETYVHTHRDRVNERNAAFLSDNVTSLEQRRRRV